jgi:hypothetical protein
LSTPEQIEVAELLARLARIDLATAEKLSPDPEMDDRPVASCLMRIFALEAVH